ncbi:PIG-L family deacetylase [Streptomyces sp. MS1.HAVA.3]|uniref:PIG-L family deacetylase n=1 Tax=Streptomyces caledonius TaxID=3134107 RepID=A0ABU8U9Q3_9ACTN
MPVTRRHFAALLTVLTAGATGVLSVATGQQTSAEATQEKNAAAVLPASVTSGSVVQIVAHPDDDLFFMNPDLSRSLLSGTQVTTAYLTSGESDGRNEAHGGAARDPEQPADRTHYAEARQNGIRAAYAQMATGDRTSAWRRTVMPTAGGGRAEVDVLITKPQVHLVWLMLREARSTGGDNPASLRGLWNGRIPALDAQLTSGTPVKEPFSYTKDQLIQAMAGVLEQYRPTTIRMQDPTPGRYGRTAASPTTRTTCTAPASRRRPPPPTPARSTAARTSRSRATSATTTAPSRTRWTRRRPRRRPASCGPTPGRTARTTAAAPRAAATARSRATRPGATGPSRCATRAPTALPG